MIFSVVCLFLAIHILNLFLGKAVRNDDGVFGSSAGESFSTAEAQFQSQNCYLFSLHLVVYGALGRLSDL